MSLFVPAAVLNHFAKAALAMPDALAVLPQYLIPKQALAALAGYATFNDFFTRALKNGAIIVRLMLCCVL